VSARQAVTDRHKGQVIDGDAVGLSQSQIAAAFDAEQGSDRLRWALWRAFGRVAQKHRIKPDDARILLMGGYAL
jgi:hypothetical protein